MIPETNSDQPTAATRAERIDAIETRWSLIRDAHIRGDASSAEDARRRLVLRYAAAIRRYVGAIVREPDAADELSQDALVRLMRGDFAGADPTRGRFRDLLKTSIRNMVKSWWESQSRRKPVNADLELIIGAENSRNESVWRQLWRHSVLEHTWERLRHDDGDLPKTAWWVLRLKTDAPDSTTEELAALVNSKTGVTVSGENTRQILSRGRRRFAAHLLDEVRAGLDTEESDNVQDELANLGLLDFVRDYLPA